MLPAPSARLTAEDTPPPIAPADIICCNMIIGNTSAIAASDATPKLPTYVVSAIAANAVDSIAAIFGRAKRSSVGRMGADSSGSGVRAWVAEGVVVEVMWAAVTVDAHKSDV